MFDLFGWFRRKVADAFTGGVADGLKSAGIATADLPPELAAMQKAAAPALPAKEEGETEPRKAKR